MRAVFEFILSLYKDPFTNDFRRTSVVADNPNINLVEFLIKKEHIYKHLGKELRFNDDYMISFKTSLVKSSDYIITEECPANLLFDVTMHKNLDNSILLIGKASDLFQTFDISSIGTAISIFF